MDSTQHVLYIQWVGHQGPTQGVEFLKKVDVSTLLRKKVDVSTLLKKVDVSTPPLLELEEDPS